MCSSLLEIIKHANSFLIYCSFPSYEGHLTAKSDVYSFGVVLLEILSGRRAVDKNRPSGEHNLVEWAKPYLASKRKVLQIFDARIDGQYSVEEALRAVNVAVRCIATEPKYRPNMKEVVKALEQIQDLSDKESLGSSQNQQLRQNLNGKSSNIPVGHSRRSVNDVSDGKADSQS